MNFFKPLNKMRVEVCPIQDKIAKEKVFEEDKIILINQVCR